MKTKFIKVSKKFFSIFIITLVAIITLSSTFYTLEVNQFAVIRQMGKIVSVEKSPGLHAKVPFIQNSQRISSKTQLYDIPKTDVITKDKKSMIADCYILWKVDDPIKYVKTLNAIEGRAAERIEANTYNAIKNTISNMTQDEIIAARGEKLTELITKEANSDIGNYGISIETAQIKMLDLPDDNKEAVYERMISERENIAALYTAQGKSEAQKIKNETDKEVSIMESNAKKEASVIIAEGEAEYMQELSDAYNTQDKADFYNYIRSIDALKASLKGENKTIILDKDSELAKVLYGNN